MSNEYGAFEEVILWFMYWRISLFFFCEKDFERYVFGFDYRESKQ